MAYLVLARRYRPRRFSEVTGQSHAVRALKSALKSGRVHHAYLFSGTRGVGKTTLARLLAKALNCLAPEEGEPCGRCEPCLAIERGSFPDLIEVDAASRTRVEETRELLESAHYAPSQGRYKVYLIDEVHMLSHHSFNALLKTLEEPPEHVKFLFATTEPQKLPTTVLSRCLQFHLKRLSPSQIVSRLRQVLQEEGVSFEEEALLLLAEAASGSLRDALSLTDQAIAFGEGEVTASWVAQMLGGLRWERLRELLEAVFSGEARRLVALLDRLEEEGADFEALLPRLLRLLHKIALAQQVPEAVADEPLSEWLREQARRLDPELVQLYYEIALTGQKQLPWAPDPRLGVEMALLRMVAFLPEGAPSESAEKRPPSVQNLQGERSAESPSEKPPSWNRLLEQLDLSPVVQNIARHLELVALEGDHFRLRLDPEYRSAYETMAKEVKVALEEALGRHLKRPVRVEVSVASSQIETPARQQERLKKERERAAQEAIGRDPIVRWLIETLGAEIVSVRPKEEPK